MNSFRENGQHEGISYVFVHPRGENLGGVYSLGLKLHRADPHCLSLVLRNETSGFRGLDDESGRVVRLPVSNSFQPVSIGDGIQFLLRRDCPSNLVIIPNFDHCCYEGAIDAASRLSRKGWNVRIVGFCHTDEEFYYELMQRYGAYISGFVAVSTRTQDEMIGRGIVGGKPFVKLPYPLESAPGRDARILSGSDLRVCYLGRLEEKQKRVSRLVEVCQYLSHLRVRCVLSIYGDGGCKDELIDDLRKLLSNCEGLSFVYEGLVHPDAVDQVLSAQDAILLVSEYEGYPLVIQEAMRAGVVPVVMAIPSGLNELITDGLDGYIVPQGDSHAIAVKLKELGENSSLLSRMRIAAKERAARELGVEGYVGELNAFISRVALTAKPEFRSARFEPPPEVRAASVRLAEMLVETAPKRLAVYGAGAFGRSLMQELADRGLSVRCLVDSCELLHNVPIEGVPCQSPLYLFEYGPDCIAVASLNFCGEIRERIGLIYDEKGKFCPKCIMAV